MKRTSQQDAIEDAIRRKRVQQQQEAACLEQEQRWRNLELQNALNPSVARDLALAELAAAAATREAAMQSARQQLANVTARKQQAESLLRQCHQEQQQAEAVLNFLQPVAPLPGSAMGTQSYLSNLLQPPSPAPAKIGVPHSLSNVQGPGPAGHPLAPNATSQPSAQRKEKAFGSGGIQCMYNDTFSAPDANVATIGMFGNDKITTLDRTRMNPQHLDAAISVASLSKQGGGIQNNVSDLYSKLLGGNSGQPFGHQPQGILGLNTNTSSFLSGAASSSSRPSVLTQDRKMHSKAPPKKPRKKIGASVKEVGNYDPGNVKALSLSSDKGNLSPYQCLLREQIVLFQVSMNDIQCSAQGRNKPIKLGQVGVLCKFCAHIPPGVRPCGAAYFPAKLSGLYQASQNMAINHFTKSCRSIPEETREQLIRVKEQKSTVLGGGKHFWANGARILGVVEHEEGHLRFKED